MLVLFVNTDINKMLKKESSNIHSINFIKPKLKEKSAERQQSLW